MPAGRAPAGESGGHRRVLSLAAAVVATLIPSLLAATAAIATDSVYNPQRVLRHHDNECLDQKPGECITVASPSLGVSTSRPIAITVACTPAFPHLVGWDSRQHEHIRVDLLSKQPGNRVAAATTAPDKVRVVATSHASAKGYVTIYAGCSRQPWAGTPFMSSREAVPGNHVGFTGGPK